MPWLWLSGQPELLCMCRWGGAQLGCFGEECLPCLGVWKPQLGPQRHQPGGWNKGALWWHETTGPALPNSFLGMNGGELARL